jgi:hypothetical protein
MMEPARGPSQKIHYKEGNRKRHSCAEGRCSIHRGLVPLSCADNGAGERAQSEDPLKQRKNEVFPGIKGRIRTSSNVILSVREGFVIKR